VAQRKEDVWRRAHRKWRTAQHNKRELVDTGKNKMSGSVIGERAV